MHLCKETTTAPGTSLNIAFCWCSGTGTILGHRCQGTGTCLNTLSSVPTLFPMLPCDAVTIMAAGGKRRKEEIIALLELGCLNNVHFSAEERAPSLNGA